MTFADRYPDLADLPADIRKGMEFVEIATSIIRDHHSILVSLARSTDRAMGRAILNELPSMTKGAVGFLIAIQGHGHAPPLDCLEVVFGLAKMHFAAQDLSKHFEAGEIDKDLQELNKWMSFTADAALEAGDKLVARARGG